MSSGNDDPALQSSLEKLGDLFRQVEAIQTSLEELIRSSGAVSSSDVSSSAGKPSKSKSPKAAQKASAKKPNGQPKPEQQELELKPLDSADLHTALAYALASLQVIQLKLRNQDFTSHEVMETTLETVKTYMARIRSERQKLVKPGKQQEGPRLRVDRPAAKRFVVAALGPPQPAPL